jgi:hypothetical protein
MSWEFAVMGILLDKKYQSVLPVLADPTEPWRLQMKRPVSILLSIIGLLAVVNIAQAHWQTELVSVDTFVIPASGYEARVEGGHISFKLPAGLAVPPKIMESLGINQYSLVLCILGLKNSDIPVRVYSYSSGWEGRDIGFTYHASKEVLNQIAAKIQNALESPQFPLLWNQDPPYCGG